MLVFCFTRDLKILCARFSNLLPAGQRVGCNWNSWNWSQIPAQITPQTTIENYLISLPGDTLYLLK